MLSANRRLCSMPYYLFKISAAVPGDLIKHLVLLEQFEQFREARSAARQLRQTQGNETQENEIQENDIQQNATTDFKVIFADSQLHAEELLLEKREPPVLMEHER